jgi:tetratricopeptide (TPR) repeat protein
MPSRVLEPLRIPAAFWRREDVLLALDDGDIGAVFRIVRQHTGASQTRIGIAVGMPQSQISVIMTHGRRQRRVVALGVLARIADGLHMPNHARQRLGLAQAVEPAPGDEPYRFVGSAEPAGTGGPDEAGGAEPVRRRDLFELAGTAFVGAAFGPSEVRAGQLRAFADALTRYPSIGTPSSPVRDLASLRRAVTTAKRMYQACRYAAVTSELPALLVALQDAAACADSDDRLDLHALSADAHHVAASVLLKLDDQGLASLAADRSMHAAELSQNPIALGASARILTHTLISGGHLDRATQFARGMADQLDRASGTTTPDSVSVYGALLLRGAIAAAQCENRADALALVDEANQAADRLGVDGNYYWTAFGPTNVLLHRVNLATTLGDAGTAIDYARQVDLDRVPVTERRATLYVDVARAFNQWGRCEQAYHAIRQAETIAPEEIRSRPAVHRLVADLLVRAPRTVRSQLRRYADEIGVQM